MKRRLALTLAAGTLAVALGVGGATLALFSAETDTATGDFVAGTVAIEANRNDGDTVPGPMFYITSESGATEYGDPGLEPTGLWAPGDTHTKALDVVNVGSLDARLVSIEAELQEGSQELAELLEVKIYEHDQFLVSGSLADFMNGPVALGSGIDLEADFMGATILWFEVTLPLETGNEFQDQIAVVAFTVNAEQVKNNP